MNASEAKERVPEEKEPAPKEGERQLFLDCDGVLADFDSYAETIFGLPPSKAEELHGAKRFWADLQSNPDFYFNLPLMPGARELYEAVKHLDPIILTGLPLGDWAEPQKRRWAEKHFPGVRVICCASKDKRLHMKPGDVLVDDWPKYRHLWEEAGGVFILHTSAEESIDSLSQLFQLKAESVDALPPLTGISGDLPLKVTTVLNCLTQRENQLKASLLREKGKDEEIERLKGLLREAVLYVNGRSQTSIRLSESIKAAVTGEQP